MVKRSCRGSRALTRLEQIIAARDLHPDVSRSEKFTRAIKKAEDLTDAGWNETLKDLKKFQNRLSADTPIIPSALQLQITDEAALETVENNIKRALGLRILQTRLEVELILLCYVKTLDDKLNEEAGEITSLSSASQIASPDTITDSEMFAYLAELLLSNGENKRNTVDSIKHILIEWRNTK